MELPGTVLGRSTAAGLDLMVVTARTTGLPFLGTIDHYDDTQFNGLQTRAVVRELEQLAEEGPESVTVACREVLALAELVAGRRHRYLQFVGD